MTPNEGDAKRLAEDTAGARKPGTATHPILKPWILPSGNRFIKDPAKRHLRPDGHPGLDPTYVSTDFDDSGWAQVTLPHNRAISGPFNTGGEVLIESGK